jgi:hypothetical protein
MQKVVGSSPIIRFAKPAVLQGGSFTPCHEQQERQPNSQGRPPRLRLQTRACFALNIGLRGKADRRAGRAASLKWRAGESVRADSPLWVPEPGYPGGGNPRHRAADPPTSEACSFVRTRARDCEKLTPGTRPITAKALAGGWPSFKALASPQSPALLLSHEGRPPSRCGGRNGRQRLLSCFLGTSTSRGEAS